MISIEKLYLAREWVFKNHPFTELMRQYFPGLVQFQEQVGEKIAYYFYEKLTCVAKSGTLNGIIEGFEEDLVLVMRLTCSSTFDPEIYMIVENKLCPSTGDTLDMSAYWGKVHPSPFKLYYGNRREAEEEILKQPEYLKDHYRVVPIITSIEKKNNAEATRVSS
jgi:hypothetical protein